MGFEDYAKRLADLLSDAEPPQLTVGIFGDYGSGKTTLMRAIEASLESHRDPSLVTVWFNAWRFDHEEHLLIPFLATLARQDQLAQAQLNV